MTEYSETYTLGAADRPPCRPCTGAVLGQEESAGIEYDLVYLSMLACHAEYTTVAGPYHLPKDTFVCHNLMQLESIRQQSTAWFVGTI